MEFTSSVEVSFVFYADIICESFLLTNLTRPPNIFDWFKALECFQEDRDGVSVSDAIGALRALSVAETASEHHARVAVEVAAAKAAEEEAAAAEAAARAEAEAEANAKSAAAAKAQAEAEAVAAAEATAKATAKAKAEAEAEAAAAAAQAQAAAAATSEASTSSAAAAQRDDAASEGGDGAAVSAEPPAVPDADAADAASPGAHKNVLRRTSSCIAEFEYVAVGEDELGEFSFPE